MILKHIATVEWKWK